MKKQHQYYEGNCMENCIHNQPKKNIVVRILLFIFKFLKSIFGIIVGLSSIAALIFSYKALDITIHGGDINISAYNKGEIYENSEINIDLIQPKVERTLMSTPIEDLDNYDWSDYDSFGGKRALQYKGGPFAQIEQEYLYINNTGKFSESDVVIQFESDDLYFDEKFNFGNKSDDEIYQGQNKDNQDTVDEDNRNTEYKETNYKFELCNFVSKLGNTTLRIKVNPDGSLYSGLTEKIMLSEIFENNLNWFYRGKFENGKATVPVKVTIAADKYKTKTFYINLNITEEEYVETEEY